MPGEEIKWYDRPIYTRIVFPISTFLLTLFLSPLILGYFCSSHKSIEVSGKVVNAENRSPLQDATIVVDGKIHVNTDNDGNFTFSYRTTKPRLGTYLCSSCENATTISLEIKGYDSSALVCYHDIQLDNTLLTSDESRDHYIEYPTSACK